MSGINENIYLNKLIQRLNNIPNEFKGLCGVCIYDPDTKWYFGINDDMTFPTASSIKIPILIKLLSDADKKLINLSDEIVITEQMKSRGSGVIHKMTGSVKMTIENLAILMINLSDNTATNLCIDIANQKEINEMLSNYDFGTMKLNRKMQDYKAINEGKENIATPKEMNLILQMLDNKSLFNESVSNKTLDILAINKSTPISQPLPENIKVAGKTGGMPGVRCETAIVYLKNRRYILTVMTSYGGQSEIPQNFLNGEYNGSDIISKISSETYKYFNTIDNSSEFGQGLTQTINY